MNQKPLSEGALRLAIRVSGVRFEPGEHPALVSLAAPLQGMPWSAGGLFLTDRRLVFAGPRTFIERVLSRTREWDVAIEDVTGVRLGSRWLSIRSGLLGAKTLRVATLQGQRAFSVYGAQLFMEALTTAAADGARAVRAGVATAGEKS